jgi:hypothetical protein
MSRRELLTIAASMAMFVPLSLRKVLAQTAVMHGLQLREAVGRSAA